MEVAKGLRQYANKLSGKEQLAVLAFANSLEIIPRTLAENAGLDPVDMLTDLKSKHDLKEGKWFGIDVMKGKLFDAWKSGVIEPLKIKTQPIKSASEVSELILRIDDVIAASGSKQEMPKMPQDYAGME
jgi:chaperonin GroEL (HSP60 family)